MPSRQQRPPLRQQRPPLRGANKEASRRWIQVKTPSPSAEETPDFEIVEAKARPAAFSDVSTCDSLLEDFSPTVVRPPTPTSTTAEGSEVSSEVGASEGRSEHAEEVEVKQRLCSSASMFIPKADATATAKNVVWEVIRFLQVLLKDMCVAVTPLAGAESDGIAVTLCDACWWATPPGSWPAARAAILHKANHEVLRGLGVKGALGVDVFELQPGEELSTVYVGYVHGNSEGLCWDFLRSGGCPRHASCRWKHLPARYLTIKLYIDESGGAQCWLPFPGAVARSGAFNASAGGATNASAE